MGRRRCLPGCLKYVYSPAPTPNPLIQVGGIPHFFVYHARALKDEDEEDKCIYGRLPS